MNYTYTKKKQIGVTLANGAMVVNANVRKIRVEDGGLFLYESANGACPDSAFSLAQIIQWGEVTAPEAAPQTDGSGNPLP